MGYVEKKSGIFDSTSEVALTSTAVVKKFAVVRPMIVRRVAIALSTAISSTGSVVVAIKKYVTMNSSVGEVSLGTITIPAGTAAGAVYYKDLAAVQKIIPGQELVFEVTTAATSAGKGLPIFDADDSPEMPANMSMTASA
jgi:hypothetical protein